MNQKRLRICDFADVSHTMTPVRQFLFTYLLKSTEQCSFTDDYNKRTSIETGQKNSNRQQYLHLAQKKKKMIQKREIKMKINHV